MSSHPTVGPSDDIDEGARLSFEGWLPLGWKKRKQIPDIHVDYRVEVVEEGEPTGLHFQAQIKGRSIHKRTAKKLSEPIKTKHLRYYMRCEEPVFLFLIDPATKRGHWLFIQKYLKEKVSSAQLQKQKTITIPFDSNDSFEHFSTFDIKLRAAWKYVRDLHPGSPIAAILAEKRRLEELDPRFAVHISATSTSKEVRVEPTQPTAGSMQIKFLKPPPLSALKDFHEKGESFRVKATDIETKDSPILTTILRELGEQEITIRDGRTFRGCLQISFRHGDEAHILQLDGEWALAPKNISFEGQLPESPLRVSFTRTRSDDLKFDHAAIAFKCDWNSWARQPLLSLAYFSQVQKFIESTDFTLRSFIRGNQLWQPESFSVDPSAVVKAKEALAWLERCRQVARQLKFGPLFPVEGKTADLETDDMRLFIQLFENGRHEQTHEGLASEISADIPAEGPQVVSEAARIELPEPERVFNFLGQNITLGPLRHIWTNVELVEKRPLQYPRFALVWRGKSESTYCIEYETFGKTTVS